MSADRYGTQAKYVTKRDEVLFNFLIQVCFIEDLSVKSTEENAWNKERKTMKKNA